MDTSRIMRARHLAAWIFVLSFCTTGTLAQNVVETPLAGKFDLALRAAKNALAGRQIADYEICRSGVKICPLVFRPDGDELKGCEISLVITGEAAGSKAGVLITKSSSAECNRGAVASEGERIFGSMREFIAKELAPEPDRAKFIDEGQKSKDRTNRRAAKLCAAHPDWSTPICTIISRGLLIPGMDKEQAIEAVGRPIRINSSLTDTTISEQWIYSPCSYLYFKNGLLETIQRSTC